MAYNSFSANSNTSKRSENGYYDPNPKRDLQEQKDLELALKLQQEYMQEQEGEGEEGDGNEVDEGSKQNDPKHQKNSKQEKGKNFKTKLADKFSSLFGKKKTNSNELPQQQQAGQKAPLKQDNSLVTKKTVQQKNYTFAQIEKMADREIVCFENPIGGGSFHLYIESPGEKQEKLNLDGGSVGQTIPLNIQKQGFDDKSYSKQYYPQQPNPYFKQDDDTHMRFNGSSNYGNGHSAGGDGNEFLFGGSKSHKFSNGSKLGGNSDSINNNIIVD